jgi:hypothetical protein
VRFGTSFIWVFNRSPYYRDKRVVPVSLCVFVRRFISAQNDHEANVRAMVFDTAGTNC